MFYNVKTKFRFLICIFFILSTLSSLGCGESSSKADTEPQYVAEIQTWQQQRIEGLRSETGWLNLAGLYWLDEGENTFGTAQSNDIVFPKGKGPTQIGSFYLKEDKVSISIRPGINVFHNAELVESMQLSSDMDGESTILRCGSLVWFVIKRAAQVGIRLRDLESPLLDEFKGIETFPISESWRVEAVLERYDPPKIIKVPNVLGTINDQPSPGALVFQVGGETHRLDPTGEIDDEKLFLIFADKTNGHTTYGAGRFLYVKTPGEDGKTVIDFNKAYNPPCAFTPYATCPLPPAQNRLAFEVTSGEKNYEGAGH